MDELQQVDQGSVEAFVRRWYGHSSMATGRGSGHALPTVLENWYVLAGRRLGEFTRYYRFLESAELAIDAEIVSFCSAPHDGEFWWGYANSGADPVTFESEDRGEWRPAGHKFSELLLYVVVSSAVLGADCGLVNMTSNRRNYEQMVALLEPLRPDIWAWPEPSLRFYCADGVIAQAGHAGGDYGYQIILGAMSEEKLTPFDQGEWEWDSRRDAERRMR